MPLLIPLRASTRLAVITLTVTLPLSLTLPAIAAADTSLPTTETKKPPPLAGEQYHIEGTLEHDTCRGEIILATENIIISADQVFADVVDRFYARTKPTSTKSTSTSDDDVEASGHFVEKGNIIDEGWSFRRAGPGRLVGRHWATWRFGDRADEPARWQAFASAPPASPDPDRRKRRQWWVAWPAEAGAVVRN